MKYTIIEDCSPYYIRFTHDRMDDFIAYALNTFNQENWDGVGSKKHPGFKHCRITKSLGKELLEKSPISNDLELASDRVSFFCSAPGLHYGAHKDGIETRVSINYTLKVLDDKCITNWYSEELTTCYPLDQEMLDKKSARECAGFDKHKHTPIKTMIAQPNECILFNTDIWHSWDNSASSNERIVLTLRTANRASMYFDDVKRILFGL